MKNKEEILKVIKDIREIRDSYRSLKQKGFNAVCNGQIRVLQWVLGYKPHEWYWCEICQLAHKGMKCPSCHGSNVLTPEEAKARH